MVRENRAGTPEFREYQEFIVNHPNYESLPEKRSGEQITWVKVGSEDRRKWWDNLVALQQAKDRATVARKIHPPELAGKKPCKICGTWLSVNYIYPNSTTRKKLELAFNWLDLIPYEMDIFEIARLVEKTDGNQGISVLAEIFGVNKPAGKLETFFKQITSDKSGLSPGAMSNAPDRLDGFHTYNACCRSEADTGRHRSNMSMYQQDRRAFENWAEGDWRAANKVMGLYQSSDIEVPCPMPRCGKLRKMSADHIGPISLGFVHSMNFQPMCKNCNSSKNNRLTKADVDKLRELEDSGEKVVSWHSKAMWDSLKEKCVDDHSARLIGTLMRKNLHTVLSILSRLKNSGFEDFLIRYLSPQHAHFDYKFDDFEPVTGKFSFRKIELNSLNTESSAERHIRVSLEALDSYSEKTNRMQTSLLPTEVHRQILEIENLLGKESYDEADFFLRKLVDSLSKPLSGAFQAI